MDKTQQYRQLSRRIEALIEDEDDVIALMATIACELYHSMDSFDWVGFYRVVMPEVLKVGPYQGGHGCLMIPFDRGVCGRAASEATTQVVPRVDAIPYHIACSSDTRAEIVVPVLDSGGQVRAVLDIDSNREDAFDEVDREHLEAICRRLGAVYK